jgi:transcriptional regulator with XRE-family HTH domain
MKPEPGQVHLALGALFSGRLRLWRTQRGLLLKEMASDLGVSLSLASALETGSRFPSEPHLEQISSYTGIPACQFLYPGPGDCPRSKTCDTSPHESFLK